MIICYFCFDPIDESGRHWKKAKARMHSACYHRKVERLYEWALDREINEFVDGWERVNPDRPDAIPPVEEL